MKGLYKETFRKILAAAMALGLALGSVSYAKSTAQNTVKREGQSTSAQESKEETVYIFTDASGNQQKVLVSEWLKNPDHAEKLQDATTLQDISNVKGDETFQEGEGDTIRWNSNGDDIYYQGTTDKETPIDVKITYTLDGEEIDPKELAGKSGKVVIRYEYTNKEVRTAFVQGKKEEVYVPFAVMTGMLFDSSAVSNVEVSSGKVITEGDRTIVVGLAFPGLEESLKLEEYQDEEADLKLDAEIPDYVEVTMDADDFSMDMSMSLVMNDLLNELDLDGEGQLDTLKEGMQTLSDGADELLDGTNELADGICELYDQVPELTDGVQQISDGIMEYTDGVAAVYDGTAELKGGSGQLASGAQSLASGAGQVNSGAGELVSGARNLSDGAGQLKDGAASAKVGSSRLVSAYAGEKGAAAGAKKLAE